MYPVWLVEGRKDRAGKAPDHAVGVARLNAHWEGPCGMPHQAFPRARPDLLARVGFYVESSNMACS
eukprot:14537695-Alexandrium_andersonii.AAC.1